MFFKISVLKNFAIFTRKHLCWSLFLIKLRAFRPSGQKSMGPHFWWSPILFPKKLSQKNICSYHFIKRFKYGYFLRIFGNNPDQLIREHLSASTFKTDWSIFRINKDSRWRFSWTSTIKTLERHRLRHYFLV